MSTIVQVHLPHQAAVPLSQGFKAQAARIGRAIWVALHAVGAARARAELMRVAATSESTNPELAARLRRLAREDWLSKG